jgi:hypothetical protein
LAGVGISVLRELARSIWQGRPNRGKPLAHFARGGEEGANRGHGVALRAGRECVGAVKLSSASALSEFSPARVRRKLVCVSLSIRADRQLVSFALKFRGAAHPWLPSSPFAISAAAVQPRPSWPVATEWKRFSDSYQGFGLRVCKTAGVGASLNEDLKKKSG